MEVATTVVWTQGNNATYTKETGTRTGGSGTRVIKVARDGTNDPWVGQVNMYLITKNYHITGWARSGGGTAKPRIMDGGGSFSWYGTTSTDWQYFDFIGSPGNTWFILRAVTSAGTEYCEFDDVIVEEMQERTLDSTGNENHLLFGDGSTPTTFPSKTEKHGYYFDGSRYLEGTIDTSILNQTEFSIVMVFRPNVEFDDAAKRMFFSFDNSALSHLTYFYHNNISSVYHLTIHSNSPPSIPDATIGSIWLRNQTNVWVLSLASEANDVYLNGTQVMADTTEAWTPHADVSRCIIGAWVDHSFKYIGEANEFYVVPYKMTQLQALDATIRARQQVNQK